MNTLAILIPQLCERQKRDNIASALREQAEDKPVEVLTFCDNRHLSSGLKRQMLMDATDAEYVAFVDDDDAVSPNYINYLLQAITSGKDVITFDLKMSINQARHNAQSFRVTSSERHRDHNRIIMQANHLCAWRRTLALRVEWPPDLGYGDDQLWYKPLHLSGELTEEHIDEVLYYYNFSHQATANQTTERQRYARDRYAGGAAVYRHGKNIAVATVGADHRRGASELARFRGVSWYECSTEIGRVTII